VRVCRADLRGRHWAGACGPGGGWLLGWGGWGRQRGRVASDCCQQRALDLGELLRRHELGRLGLAVGQGLKHEPRAREETRVKTGTVCPQ